jgi:hypothetical protein
MNDEGRESGLPRPDFRPSPNAPASPLQSRRWVGFFVILGILGTAAIVINLVYNVSQQLKPEQLAAARALWKEKAPPDYDLDYVIKDEEATGGTEPLRLIVDRISVHVRDGKIQTVSRNGAVVPDGFASSQMLAILACVPTLPGAPPTLAAGLVAQQYSYGVGPLFDLIHANLERDGQPGGQRTFTHALFDKGDGHPIHYVRRVMGTRRRLEIIIQLTDPSDLSPKPPLLPG